MKVTVEQKNVIEAPDKHMECNAFAGTGKSFTMELKIQRLLKQGVDPKQILVLSFTKTAVGNIRNKLDLQIDIGTFHAFCLALVKSHYKKIGFTRMPKMILENAGKLKLLNRCLVDSKGDIKPLRDMIDITHASEQNRLLRFFDRIQGDKKLAKALVADKQSEFRIYKGMSLELSLIYRRFKKLKVTKNAIDYSDILIHGNKLIGAAAKGWDYQYLFIDEAQDMTRSQARLLKVLAAFIPNIATFGDPYQSIYGFAGSEYQSLSSLLGQKVKTFELTKSFRLTQPNAALVSALFNQMSEDAPAISGGRSDVMPLLVKTNSQAELISDHIKAIRSTDPTASIAILGRTKAQLRDSEIHLMCSQIDINPLGRDLHRAHLNTVLNMIELLLNYEAALKGKRIKNDVVATKLLSVAGVQPASLSRAVIGECVRRFKKGIAIPSLSGRYMQISKLYTKLIRVSEVLNMNQVKDISKALGQMEPYFNGEANLKSLRKRIMDLEASPKVVTATIHAVKGLEYDHVFLLNVVQGSVPFYMQSEKGETAEELRLFYVACSRARKQTILIQAPYYSSGGKEHKVRSEFLTKPVRALLEIS